MKTFIILLLTIFFSIAFLTVIGLIKKNEGFTGLLKQKGEGEGEEKTSASRFVLLLSGLASVIIGFTKRIILTDV
ncbi:hypothetical protein [Aquimarina macrocephali]|uniref:hypothetical protein n=1 Tax=Aquimarina macrocephali TaxID=666563 RepID=UPI003F675052